MSIIPAEPDYKAMRNKAKEIFWKKFEEPKIQSRQIDHQQLRLVANDFFAEYWRFWEIKHKLKLSIPSSVSFAQKSEMLWEINILAQAPMAALYNQLEGTTPVYTAAALKDKEYRYYVPPGDSMQLGKIMTWSIFGSLVIRAKDAIKEVDTETVLNISESIPNLKSRPPRETRNAKVTILFGDDIPQEVREPAATSQLIATSNLLIFSGPSRARSAAGSPLAPARAHGQ